MFKVPEKIDEVDIERHMSDNASRVEMNSLLQRRYANLQKLLLKAQVLSDKDFETAFTTFESVVDSLNQKTQKNPNSDKQEKNKLTGLITPNFKG